MTTENSRKFGTVVLYSSSQGYCALNSLVMLVKTPVGDVDQLNANWLMACKSPTGGINSYNLKALADGLGIAIMDTTEFAFAVLD